MSSQRHAGRPAELRERGVALHDRFEPVKLELGPLLQGLAQILEVAGADAAAGLFRDDQLPALVARELGEAQLLLGVEHSTVSVLDVEQQQTTGGFTLVLGLAALRLGATQRERVVVKSRSQLIASPK
jgi:hypothetical protein